MSTLSVIVGLCGSGKSELLKAKRFERGGSSCFMDEGFLFPDNERDHRERAEVVRALSEGRDAFVTLMDCLFAENRDKLEATIAAEAPGTDIAWLFFENDADKANNNCLRDPRRPDPLSDIAQNNRSAPHYSIPASAQVISIFELPPGSRPRDTEGA